MWNWIKFSTVLNSTQLTRFVTRRSLDQHTSPDGCGSDKEEKWTVESISREANWSSARGSHSLRLCPFGRAKKAHFSPQSPSQVTFRIIHHNSWKLTTNKAHEIWSQQWLDDDDKRKNEINIEVDIGRSYRFDLSVSRSNCFVLGLFWSKFRVRKWSNGQFVASSIAIGWVGKFSYTMRWVAVGIDARVVSWKSEDDWTEDAHRVDKRTKSKDDKGPTLLKLILITL